MLNQMQVSGCSGKIGKLIATNMVSAKQAWDIVAFLHINET
jgi:hypothetical protein